MHRPLLLCAACVLAASAQGQDLLTGRRYIVFKEELVRVDVNPLSVHDVEVREVSYLMTPIKGGLQVRELFPYSGSRNAAPTTGSLICQVTNLKYLRHSYKGNMLAETYLSNYRAFPEGKLPPLPKTPNPSVKEAMWQVHPDGVYALNFFWYFGPKKANTFFGQSYYSYTLFCRRY